MVYCGIDLKSCFFVAVAVAVAVCCWAVKAPAAEEELAVCVLQDFEAMRMEKQKKAKDLPKKKANKPMKEIRIGVSCCEVHIPPCTCHPLFNNVAAMCQALCDTHDLNTKLSKVKNFLGDGLQVKVSIFSRKVVTREHPLALDETTLRVLDGLESVAGPVQSVSKESSRVEFIISPMKKKE